MRYFVVEYLQQPDGKYNERASVHKSIKPNLLVKAMVILDFKNRKIDKLRVDPNMGERDFDRIVGFYRTHGYQKILDQLEEGYKIINEVEKLAEEVNTN